jgi:hypothetical protein
MDNHLSNYQHIWAVFQSRLAGSNGSVNVGRQNYSKKSKIKKILKP